MNGVPEIVIAVICSQDDLELATTAVDADQVGPVWHETDTISDMSYILDDATRTSWAVVHARRENVEFSCWHGGFGVGRRRTRGLQRITTSAAWPRRLRA
jgi:hypothetical protein